MKAALGGLLLALAVPGWASPASLSVCVYFDGRDSSGYQDGELHAIMLENLLGHFQEAKVELRPAGAYAAGGLASCDRAAYVGSRYEAPLPRAFLREALAFSRPFLWINYNIGQLQAEAGPAAFSRKAGFSFAALQGFDPPGQPGRVPGFYRDFHYKGKRFWKLAFVRRGDGALVGDPEIAILRADSARVLARAAHSETGESTPYVTEKAGFFYVADNPFLFIHEQDRYLILADLLFDFLRLPPRAHARYALARLEDIHPNYDLGAFYRAVDVFRRRGLPFAVSLIPAFVPAGAGEGEAVTLGQRPEFLKALRYATRSGGEILLHGYTHNAGALAGCPPLPSGADFEFWDRCRQQPLPYDSEEFVRLRVAKATALLAAAGLSAVAWVTPHYCASPLDFVQFGLLFPRTLQRVRYVPDRPEPGRAPVFASQFFPYTIYRDHYGQFVWPEDLGFVPMPGSEAGSQSAESIEASAALLSVVRDAWASFYWHPQLANVEGEIPRLEEIVSALQRHGYRFVSLRSLAARGE